MTVLGALYIKANVDKALFIVVITEMQLFGLLMKSTYYLHVHPWEKLNPNYKTYVKIHQGMTGLFIAGIVATVIYYAVTSTIKIFTITVIFLFIPIGLVSYGNTYNILDSLCYHLKNLVSLTIFTGNIKSRLKKLKKK